MKHQNALSKFLNGPLDPREVDNWTDEEFDKLDDSPASDDVYSWGQRYRTKGMNGVQSHPNKLAAKLLAKGYNETRIENVLMNSYNSLTRPMAQDAVFLAKKYGESTVNNDRLFNKILKESIGGETMGAEDNRDVADAVNEAWMALVEVLKMTKRSDHYHSAAAHALQALGMSPQEYSVIMRP